ncbi:calcium-binding protein [Nocardioides campestrisoli]|uniref:calcium-binding protein n=1 Tax=Nocardioides campestrisoli TaxID=2736757 RepID=UPI00163D742A|nr:calcium-binding protein [Nocardioides campestrisoli]
MSVRIPSRSRLLAGLAATCLGASGLAAVGVGPAYAVETCRGAAATVVGTPGVPLTATPGNDVVVTNGASVVSALGGDDLVCVTGGTPYVDTATGDDVVDTISAGDAPASVFLGAGSDRFFGGEGADTVGTHGEGLVADVDADTLLTGGGDDVVASGAPGQPNADTVDLGPGNDRLALRGVTARTAGSISGGRNSDTLDLDLSGSASWWIHNGKGVANRNEKRQHNWVAFEQFDLVPTAGRFIFRGSPSNERLRYTDASGGPVGSVLVTMDAGNDHVEAAPQAATDSRYDGGEGRDELEISSPGERLTVDLGAGQVLRGGRKRGALVATATGFTDATVWARNATAKGDGQGNRLSVGGCTVRAYGLGRGDVLKRLDSPAYGCGKRSKMLGGPGRDKLVGGEGRDKLYGGPGRDKAVGGPGRDLCQAEKRKSCERR